ncbi:MAG: peptide deformylase [Alphaproteobacteria bacterium]|nr:peptide deformylase [Alphaproteobacteria bacterium]MCB9929124.1 peptide deformylase [Alphaproteobacteria bacterium]
MAIRKIARMGHPVLLQRAAEVPDPSAVRDLIRDMAETLVDSGGIGLAAPQIHESVRLILVSVPAGRSEAGEGETPITALINPVLTPVGDDRVVGWEGCLSIPGLRGAVPRFRTVRFEALDADGAPVAGEAEGMMARVLQHEVDHLDGILYPMRMTDHSQFGFDQEIGRYALGRGQGGDTRKGSTK